MFPMQAYNDSKNLFASLVGQSNKRSVLTQKKIDQWLQTRSKSINEKKQKFPIIRENSDSTLQDCVPENDADSAAKLS